MAYVALLDASVLHPWVVCDLILRLAERGLYRPAWSDAILDELVGSLTERMPGHEERFRRRREHMEAAFAEAMEIAEGGNMPPVGQFRPMTSSGSGNQRSVSKSSSSTMCSGDASGSGSFSAIARASSI